MCCGQFAVAMRMPAHNCSHTARSPLLPLFRGNCAVVRSSHCVHRIRPIKPARAFKSRWITPTIQNSMFASLKNLVAQGAKASATPTANFSDNAPSWENLMQLARTKQTELGLDFWADPEQGTTNPMALKRTFGKAEPIRIKLYRDHAAWCPYCHKVWLQLELKQIPYVMEKINMRCYGDKPREFMQKVPSGLLPVLEVDGRVITESMVIMNLLEQMFPESRPLLPPQGTPERTRAEALMRLERRAFSDWLSWLTSNWDDVGNRRQFEATMDVVDRELQAAGGPFFLGKDISLVDVTFVPMLERMVASLAYYKGLFMRGQGRWPAIERWFAALEQMPEYMGTKSDFYTHCHDLPPQLGGCAMTAAGEPVAAMIDGTDGKSWQLPLPPLSATSLPEPYSPGDNPAVDTLEAAAKLIKNHEAVAKFALRGPGKPGPRPVSAPLADPTGVPALEHLGAMDAALRHVVHALLVGVDAKQALKHALQVSGSSCQLPGGPIILAAEYLRDRVGVPRDMRFPAARQLRAHLNWLINHLSA